MAKRSSRPSGRKGRSAGTFARRAPTREPYDFVLIVCEGKKTEPNYLNGLRAKYSLSSTNIIILHSGATDPKSIVEFALQEMEAEPYDRAFCVFDRDGHGTYDKALQIIAASPEGKADRLLAITSWPCFELWLLLHFVYTSSPYAGSANRSAGDKLLADLRQHLANYQKGQKGWFEALFSKLDTAIKNAKRLEQHNHQTNATNPHTKVHQLVTYLIGLKKS
jgi:RloB-like protein